MPKYLYECIKCNQQKEVKQKISDAPLTDCDCGEKNSLKRIIQPTAIMFKGSGFHINDYASSNNKGNETNHKKPSTDNNTGKSGCNTDACGCNPKQ